MYNYLTEISERALAVWLGSLLLVIIIKLCFEKESLRRSSFEYSLFLFSVLSIGHHWIETGLLELYAKDIYPVVAAHAWYLSFAITDFVLVLIVVKLHKKLNMSRSYCSIMFMICFTVMGLIQMARYVDRYWTETDMLIGLYRHGIPTINSMLTIAVLWFSLQITRNIAGPHIKTFIFYVRLNARKTHSNIVRFINRVRDLIKPVIHKEK